MTRYNPLEYTDAFDMADFEPDLRATRTRTMPRTSSAKAREAFEMRRKLNAREWDRIKRHLISPKQRELAISKMAESPHDFNLIIVQMRDIGVSEDTEDDDVIGDRLAKQLSQYVQPRAINLVVDPDILYTTSAAGLRTVRGKTQMIRESRESIYTAHTIAHRIGDEIQLSWDTDPNWWGWRKFTNDETYMAKYIGRSYKETLVEGVMRAAGLYLSDPARSFFQWSDEGFVATSPVVFTETQFHAIEVAALRVARTICLPTALLATDPNVVRAAAAGTRWNRFGPGARFGYLQEDQDTYEESDGTRGRGGREIPLAGPRRTYDMERQTKRLVSDIKIVLSRISLSLVYNMGTTWISRQGIASDYGQVIAETVAQTELYRGVKFRAPDVMGPIQSDYLNSRTRRPPAPRVAVPEDLRAEVQEVLPPLERAFDAYNMAILDGLVGRTMLLR